MRLESGFRWGGWEAEPRAQGRKRSGVWCLETSFLRGFFSRGARENEVNLEL